MDIVICFMIGFTTGALGMFVATLVAKYIWNPGLWRQKERDEFLREIAIRISKGIKDKRN